jgi:hypothetical protein
MRHKMKLVALALSILMISCASSGTYFRWDDVRALQIGMTKQEVIDRLGPPNRTIASKVADGLQEKYIWSYAKVGMMMSTQSKSISVIFLNGKTVSVPTVPEEYRD